MPRYDKYEPKGGGFRAPLAADWAAADGAIVAVGLDNQGRVVPGAGTTGIVGVCVLVKTNKKAGNIVDVMTDGEIVEAGLAAGTIYAGVDADGTIVDGAPGTGETRIGFTVEANRLVVRAAR